MNIVLGSGTALNVRSFGGPIAGATPDKAALEYDPAGNLVWDGPSVTADAPLSASSSNSGRTPE